MADRLIDRRTFMARAIAMSATAAFGTGSVFGSAQPPRIRIGQIGTEHAHASKIGVYRRSDAYEVVGVVEPDDRRWEAARSQPAYRDLPRLTESQLLDTPGLSVVAVETHVRESVETARRCVDAGKHVHLDKPAGTSLEPFRQLLDAATNRKLLVQLGYMLRHSPATLLLHRLLKEGALGDVFEVHGVMSKVVGAAERKRLAEFKGGMLFELGCHLIDSVVGLLGEPLRVVPLSTKSKLGEADGLVDNGLAAFVYRHATATVRSTALEVEGGPRRHLVVCGTNGTFRCEPLESPQVRLTLARDVGGFKAGTQVVPMPKYERYVGDAADMAAILRGEKASDYPPAHDLLTHRCVLEASGMAT
jgi:predicted dehydrogenase